MTFNTAAIGPARGLAKTAPRGASPLHELKVRFARMDDSWEPRLQEGFMRTEVFIGIDISKPRLDVFNLATGEVLEFANSPSGIQALMKYAKKGM